MASDVKTYAYNFEAVKIAMKQDKTGHVLTLSIHPNDVPDDLHRDWVGSRYGIAMVRLGDDDTPIKPQSVFDGEKAVKHCAILCKDEAFQRFVGEIYPNEIPENLEDPSPEGTTIFLVRTHLEIESRGELASNAEALSGWKAMVTEYHGWRSELFQPEGTDPWQGL